MKGRAVEVDCLVVGAGLAGAVAALRLRRAGKSVCVLADGAGATELSSGSIAAGDATAGEEACRLIDEVPGAFARGADGKSWRAATDAGRLVEVLAAPPGTLDLSPGRRTRVAVVGAELSGAPDLAGLVALLADAAGGKPAFVAVPVPVAVHDDLALLSAGAAAARLRADPETTAALARTAARGAKEAGADAVLLPSWVPAAAVGLVAEASGLPAGRMLGSYGTVPGGRALAEALRAALAGAGLEPVKVRVRTLVREGERWVAAGEGGTPSSRARAAIVAVGDGAGGGVHKRGRLAVEPAVGSGLSVGGVPLDQDSALRGPAADAFLPRRLFTGERPAGVGVTVDEELVPPGAPAGLRLAGAAACPPARSVHGLAWAVASAVRAAQATLEYLDGRGDPRK